MRVNVWALLLFGVLWSALQSTADATPDYRGAQLLTFDSFASFTRESRSEAGDVVLVSPRVAAAIPWTELVVSWNVPATAALKVEARAFRDDRPGRYYVLGHWSTDSSCGPRESVPGQKDADGEVQTDVLVLQLPAREFQLRLTFPSSAPGNGANEFLAVSLLDPTAVRPPLPPNRRAWGSRLKVPVRSQADYPEGVRSWCSPTSTTMLLAYWARELRRPELDWFVPQVARAVNDPQWPGTGNWPFNTAFVGMQPGMRACVARLTDVAELENWIEHGLPVAASVSYALLRGKPKPELGDGHLVVVTGFTKAGDVLVNDPGVRRERVRRVVPRSAFDAAWARSHQTVYLVWPADAKLPPDSRGHW